MFAIHLALAGVVLAVRRWGLFFSWLFAGAVLAIALRALAASGWGEHWLLLSSPVLLVFFGWMVSEVYHVVMEPGERRPVSTERLERVLLTMISTGITLLGVLIFCAIGLGIAYAVIQVTHTQWPANRTGAVGAFTCLIVGGAAGVLLSLHAPMTYATGSVWTAAPLRAAAKRYVSLLIGEAVALAIGLLALVLDLIATREMKGADGAGKVFSPEWLLDTAGHGVVAVMILVSLLAPAALAWRRLSAPAKDVSDVFA